MTIAEFKVNKTESKRTIKNMCKGFDVDGDENSSSRGLEFQTPREKRICEARKEDIYSIVRVMQEMQREEGIIDEQDIAEAYALSTKWSKEEARELGKKDELEVLQLRWEALVARGKASSIDKLITKVENKMTSKETKTTGEKDSTSNLPENVSFKPQKKIYTTSCA